MQGPYQTLYVSRVRPDSWCVAIRILPRLPCLAHAHADGCGLTASPNGLLFFFPFFFFCLARAALGCVCVALRCVALGRVALQCRGWAWLGRPAGTFSGKWRR